MTHPIVSKIAQLRRAAGMTQDDLAHPTQPKAGIGAQIGAELAQVW